MSRNISVTNLSALQANKLVARDFLRIIARDRDTGAPIAVNFWSDVGNVSAQVISPNTGLATSYDFYGSGTLIHIDDIALVSNLSVQRLNIRLSQLNDQVNQAVREYDCKQAVVEVYRGLFNTTTRAMVAPAYNIFVGFVDVIEITTPSENSEGSVILTCVSHTQEMTRSNPDTRSHESQILRSPTDNFFADVSTIGERELFWGKTSGKIDTVKTPSGGSPRTPSATSNINNRPSSGVGTR